MSLPPGAGPYGARFAGDPWVPPSAAPTGAAGEPTSSTARPQIATASARLDDAGRMVATLTPPPSEAWLVHRIVVQASAPGRALVYVGPIAPENVVSGTVAGALDENDTGAGYLVPESVPLSVHWQSTPTTAHLRIEYRPL